MGEETELVKGRYPVEYDPIRRYCHMRDDENPLFLDPEYAKKAGYRGVVCPPLLVGYFAGQGIWPPVEEGPRFMAIPILPPSIAQESPRSSINMATEWEFMKPVIVGDQLYSKERIGDVYMKALKRDPEALWQVTETIVSNQDGEVVAIAKTINVGWKR
ncbi:MaoC family dehydratase N-terminal domain-containing protein [Chloroflexota bacterium]